jgi:hypothetical protein
MTALGTVIGATQVGNTKRLVILSEDVNRLIGSVKDTNMKFVVEKERWAYYFLSFSLARNRIFSMCKRQKLSHYTKLSPKAKKLVGNLEVLDGLKTWLSFQVCFAFAFFCSFRQLVQYPLEAT